MVSVLSSMDLLKGKRAEKRRMYGVSQPLQFIPSSRKNDEWAAWNLDWLEWNGLKQIRNNARRLMKNYKLAEGIIDKSDYIIEQNNEYNDIIEQISQENEIESMELKFYPIIPNVIKTLVDEFAKRNRRITFKAVDEYTMNEILDSKYQQVMSTLVKEAEDKLKLQLAQMGIDVDNPQDEEQAQQVQQVMSEENIMSLPQIQEYYDKNYQIAAEKWATRQYNIDEERFAMDELEQIAFIDKLVADREFWHFKMYEDDYDIELWNPVLTFYHKSPSVRYISDAQFVGKIDVMTAADIVDCYGWNMTDDQLKQLENHYMSDMPGYSITGYQNDGAFYDTTKSHDWNTNRPGLAYRQFIQGESIHTDYDVIGEITEQSEDDHYQNRSDMFRVTTAYWKSQRQIGWLTKVDELGNVTNQMVSDWYKPTIEPVYNTTLNPNKTAENLVYGEHIEWIWINQVWGGVKIGPNAPTFYGMENTTGIEPIYIGINQNKIGPIKFQFKGEKTIYGAKLPVEGRVFSDRNTKSMSLVDSMKPFQIAYNIVNNQIQDILMTEIGQVVMFDQNTLPKHSMGEDWGKNNLAKAYEIMKDYGLMPLDTTITNTENATNFQHFQQMDLSQNNRLQTRISLAQYFKQQAFEQVGISPQRMGTPIGATTSATEVEQIQVGSYAQTELHFIDHCDNLMPRVHRMRTDLAQWYACNSSSIRQIVSTSEDERQNFEINGTDLLLRDINVYSTTKANHRRILEQMKQLAMNNNTTGGSLFDLGQILQADSIGTLNSALKKAEDKAQKKIEQEQQMQQQMQQQMIQAQQEEKQHERDHEWQLNEAKMRNNVVVAEIRAAGYGSMMDIDENKRSDFADRMDEIRKSDEFNQQIDIQREKIANQKVKDENKMALEREKLAVMRENKDKDLQIARENKNQYDVKQNTKQNKK